MIPSAVSVHSPESYCSLRGFAAQSPSIWWRIHCEPTETAVRFHGDCAANWKIFEPVEKILLVGDSTANVLRLTANALQMRCECAETLKTEKCSIRSGVGEQHKNIILFKPQCKTCKLSIQTIGGNVYSVLYTSRKFKCFNAKFYKFVHF